MARWQGIWNGSLPMSAKRSGIEQYFRQRGLEAVQTPDLRWRREGSILARISDFETDQTVGFLQTFVDPRGRKRHVSINGQDQSRLTHVSSKGVIRLGQENLSTLVVGEGIETVLSARCIGRLRHADLVSLVNAGNLAQAKIPARYRTVYIIVDIEPSGNGLKAAEALAARSSREGQRVFLVTPRLLKGENKADLNDVIQREDIRPGVDYTITEWRPGSESTFLFDGDVPVEPPPALVKGLIGYDPIYFIGGQSGAAKSFLACDLTASLASGTPFLGRKVRERVGVVLIIAEGASTIPARVKVARQHKGLDKPLPIAWTTKYSNLCDAQERQALIAEIQLLSVEMDRRFGVRAGAVICDTLGAAFALSDEDDNSEANRVARYMREIASATGTVFIPLHHYGKTAETGLRGASAWRGLADGALSVLVERGNGGVVKRRSLAVHKSRVGEEGPIGDFTLKFVELGRDEDGDPYGACYIELCDSPEDDSIGRAAADYLKAVDLAVKQKLKTDPAPAYEGVDREGVREEFYKIFQPKSSTSRRKADAQRQQFKRGEEEARERGLIKIERVHGRDVVTNVT